MGPSMIPCRPKLWVRLGRCRRCCWRWRVMPSSHDSHIYTAEMWMPEWWWWRWQQRPTFVSVHDENDNIVEWIIIIPRQSSMVHRSSGNVGYDTQRRCDGCHCPSGSSLFWEFHHQTTNPVISPTASLLYIYIYISFTCLGWKLLSVVGCSLFQLFFLFVCCWNWIYTDPLLLLISSAVNELDVISVLALYPFTTWSVHLQRKQQQPKLHARVLLLLLLIQSVVTIQRLERDIYRKIRLNHQQYG